MLEVEVATRNGTAVCLPKGDMDVTTLSTFRGAVGLCLGEPGLIVDLSGVDFIDGAGLTALVGAERRAREQRARVAVVVPPGRLRKVLGEAGLDLVVRVSETVDLALAEIQTMPALQSASIAIPDRRALGNTGDQSWTQVRMSMARVRGLFKDIHGKLEFDAADLRGQAVPASGVGADGVQFGDGVGGHHELHGGDVLAQVGTGRGARDHGHGARPLQQPGQRNLLR